jgi:acetoin utilization protein AcuB
MTTVEKIMSRHVASVHMDDTVDKVRKIFAQSRFHHLLVMENHRPVGIISDRDLLKAVSPYVDTAAERERDTATLRRHAHQIMSRHLITIAVDATVIEAIRMFVNEKISCLPVLNLDGSVAGILTWRDILRAIINTVEKSHKDH